MKIKNILTGLTALALTSLCLFGCSNKKENEESSKPAPLIKTENEQIPTEAPTEPPVEKKYDFNQITQRDESASMKEFEINLEEFNLLEMTPESLNGFAKEYKDEAEPFVYQNDDFFVYGVPYSTNENVVFYVQAVYNETAGEELVGRSTNYIDYNAPEQYDIVSVTFTRDGYQQGLKTTSEDYSYFNFNLADILRLNMTKEQIKSRVSLTTALPKFEQPTYLVTDTDGVLMYITFAESEDGTERVDRITLMKNGYQKTALHETEIPAPTEAEASDTEIPTYSFSEENSMPDMPVPAQQQADGTVIGEENSETADETEEEPQ